MTGPERPIHHHTTTPRDPARRPFRHLCPEADARDAMSDDEFWAHVARNLGADDPYDPDPDDEPLDPIDAPACPVCGSSGACMYDAEGRPLIHTTEASDD